MGDAPGLFVQPRNTMPRITTVWMFVSVDRHDGNEGIVAATIGGVFMPLIAADEARLEVLRPYARTIALQSGMRIRLVKLTTREELELFDPTVAGHA